MACLTIQGVLIHHWNQNELTKLLIWFVHVIEVENETTNKEDLSVVRIEVGCERIETIPTNFNMEFDK